MAEGERMILRTVYLTFDQRDALRALGEATRIPWSVFVREAIDMILERNRHLLPEPKEVSEDA